MGSIQLKTELPGPRSREIVARRLAAVAGCVGKSTDIVVESASGALVRDVDGNQLIDLAGGIGMLAVGHCDGDVVAAVQEQTARLIHPCFLVATYEPYVRLAELLNEVAPGDFAKKTILANSGAEAVENAVKMARAHTKRQAVIVFEGAYHGRTLLTMTMTSKYGLFKKGFGPFAPEVYRLPVPNVYRTPPGMTEEQYIAWSCENLDQALVSHVDPSAIAAIVIEPVLGEAGFIPVPCEFLRKIRAICDAHGIVMIADEIQSGMGRTGRVFAIEHSGVVPDMVISAKSLGAGMPIAAVIGRAEIMDAPHLGGAGGTYGGAPTTCAAAIAAVEKIRTPEFLAMATHKGHLIRTTLECWKQKYELVGDVRGLGAMMLFENVLDRTTKAPAPNETLAIIKRAVANGLLLIRAGLYSNCVRLLPPIVITDEQLGEGLAVLEEAVAFVDGQRRQQAAG